jgi:uncharacterized protein YfaS (alpha-2-macroglobulin family)
VVHADGGGNFGHISSLTLTADRPTYQPGDTAQLIIRSAASGPSLLTFARGQWQRQQVVQLTSPVTVIAVPVTAEDAPNLSITLQQWAENEYPFDPERYYPFYSVADNVVNYANLELTVTDPATIAHVIITPEKEIYAPGEQATFTLHVTNYLGQPISAELNLALTPDALYGQYATHIPLLHDIFYPQRNNAVITAHSMSLSRYFDGFGGCGCGGDWWGEPVSLMSNFDDTAVWFPSLVTDYNGEATVTLTMPESIGTWRLSARAVTADTQVSETVITVVTE